MTKNKYVSLARQKLSHIFTKIAFKPLRTNLFNIVLLSFFLTLGTTSAYSQDIKKKILLFLQKRKLQKQKKTKLKT